MKEILKYYARCNQLINEAMLKVIREGIDKPYNLALEGYFFKSLGAVLDHIFVSDMIWMKAFVDLDPYGLDLESAVGAIPNYGDRVFGELPELETHRTKLDGFIVDYMDRADDHLFTGKVTRRTRDGQLIEKPALNAVFHFFNHQTHHRGQISNILDNLQIENNYSNMIFLV